MVILVEESEGSDETTTRGVDVVLFNGEGVLPKVPPSADTEAWLTCEDGVEDCCEYDGCSCDFMTS